MLASFAFFSWEENFTATHPTLVEAFLRQSDSWRCCEKGSTGSLMSVSIVYRLILEKPLLSVEFLADDPAGVFTFNQSEPEKRPRCQSEGLFC